MARTSSYYLYEKFEKRGDQDWIPSYPNVYSKDGDGTMPLVVRIARDYECGWHCDPEYQWVELPITSGYVCDECGELGQVTHKWELVEGYICEGTSKYQKLNLNVNVGNGWEEVSPIISKPGELIEENSLDCGYQNPRMRATLADGTIKEIPYTTGMTPTSLLDADDIMDYGIPISQVKVAEFYGGELYTDTFAGCQTLSSVTFHNGETLLGDYYFFSTGVRSFSGKIDSFGSTRYGGADFAFANCKNLTAFTETSETYHDGISGYGIFANCTGLTSIDLSMLGMYGTIDYDGGNGEARYLFGGCTSLRTAKVALSLTERSTDARNEIPIACFDNCTSLTDVEIYCGFWYGDTIYAWSRFTVKDRAFYNCRSLTSITMSYHSEEAAPDEYTIANCVGTTGVTDPVTYIGSVGRFAFYGCTGLSSITLNCTDVTETHTQTNAYIGDYAFYGCTGLTEIILDEVNPPSLGVSAFDNTTCTIYVPSVSVNTYRNAEGWSTYASRIQAIQ